MHGLIEIDTGFKIIGSLIFTVMENIRKFSLSTKV